MSFDIPYDLIKQVQAAVLKEANFSLYDLNDASYPELPSFESSIPELDLSPPYLRCKHCKGRLLRGVNSLICVFCGKQVAPQDAPPEPINFKTAFGCRWLLESLALDESEIVVLPVQENESNRRQNIAHEEFPLSDLLDLEITWNPEFDKVGTESNKSSLNQAGVNLDNFLAERKRDDASAVSVEQSLPIKNDNDSGNNDFQVCDNITLFENAQLSETAARSTENKSASGSFGGWEADFLSASTSTSREESKSVDPIVGSSVDLSAQMDVVFGSLKSLGKDKEDIVSSGSKTNDLFQGDLYSSSNSGISGQSKQLKLIANEKDGKTVHDANTSSMSIDWIQDGRWQSESNKALNSKTIDKEDDSFDSWNDFTSSATASHLPDKQTVQPKSVEENLILKDGGKVENTCTTSSRSIGRFHNDRLHPISISAPDNEAIVEENDTFDAWNDFASSTTAQDHHNRQSGQIKQSEMTNDVKDDKAVETANSSSSLNVDWFQNYQLQTNSTNAPDDKTMNRNDDFFDPWNDFTSSTSAQDPSKQQTCQTNLSEATTIVKDGGMLETANGSTSIAWIQDDHWPTISNKTLDNKATDEGDDLSDTWNDFTSSTTAQDSTNKQTGQAKNFEVDANVKDHRIVEVSNSSFDWFQGDQWQTRSKKAPDNKTFDEDSFDAWNDFTSSTGAQDPSDKQSVNHLTPSVEQTSEIKLLTTRNVQNLDFGSFSEPHIFSGASNNQNVSAEVNILTSEPSLSTRIPDENEKDGGNAGEAAKGDVSSATTQSSTNDAETLMSQMHDLSFMLANDLSIPAKGDGFTPISND